MTLVEAASVVLLLGVALFVAAGSMRWVRTGAKDRLAATMMVRLGEAVAVYRTATGAYPQPDAGADVAPCDQAVRALLAASASAEVLAGLPAVLHSRADDDRPCLIDPWCRPLRYLGPADSTGRVAANDGQPVFVMADGRGSDDVAGWR